MKSPIGTISKENYNVYNGDFKFSSIHWNTLSIGKIQQTRHEAIAQSFIGAGRRCDFWFCAPSFIWCGIVKN